MGNTAHKRTMKVDRRLQKSAYSQSHGGREDFLRPLNDPKLVFNGIPWDRVKHQLECPFHLQRLTEPTILHTLYDISFLLLLCYKLDTSGLIRLAEKIVG